LSRHRAAGLYTDFDDWASENLKAKRISCGVIVTDGNRLLLGHASRSPRWDIPKGVAEADEPLLTAAVRELFEETGLQTDPDDLRPLGTHIYLRDKDVALFAWHPGVMPNPLDLRCSSLVELPGGKSMPEFDRFGLFELDNALGLVGRTLSRVLAHVWPMIGI
jgi:putative (di)nucleoside polyphosphate hydrolase